MNKSLTVSANGPVKIVYAILFYFILANLLNVLKNKIAVITTKTKIMKSRKTKRPFIMSNSIDQMYLPHMFLLSLVKINKIRDNKKIDNILR